MSTKRPRTLHLRDPYMAEVKDLFRSTGQFTLSFSTPEKTVELHLDRSWVPYIAEQLKKVVDHERRVLRELEQVFKE